MKYSLILILILITACSELEPSNNGSYLVSSNLSLNNGETLNNSSSTGIELEVEELVKVPEYFIRPYEQIARDQFFFWHFDNLIIPTDSTRLSNLKYNDIVTRYFSRNTSMQYIGTYEAYSYTATFSNGQEVEMLVGLQSPKEEADYLSQEVAKQLGQIPELIVSGLISFTIFVGDDHGPSGKNTEHWIKNIGEIKLPQHEELLIHHLTHASIDWGQTSPANNNIISNIDNKTVLSQVGKVDKNEWLAAAQLDNYYISDYARNNPIREDIAETMPAFLASRLRPERFDPKVIKMINDRLNNRFLILDKLEITLP